MNIAIIPKIAIVRWIEGFRVDWKFLFKINQLYWFSAVLTTKKQWCYSQFLWCQQRSEYARYHLNSAKDLKYQAIFCGLNGGSNDKKAHEDIRALLGFWIEAGD